MKKMGVAKFKEQCLWVLGHLDAEGLVVTKHGRPLARVFPYREAPGDIIGILKNKVRVNGDILTTN